MSETKIFFSKKLDFGIKFLEKVLPCKSSKLNTLYWQMITSNVLRILIVRKIIFYMRVKHKIGYFERFFKGAKMFLIPNPNYPELSDFGAKKFEAPLKKKNPEISPITCFANIQNLNGRLLESVVHQDFYVPVQPYPYALNFIILSFYRFLIVFNTFVIQSM
jgi:hypothetical protein